MSKTDSSLRSFKTFGALLKHVRIEKNLTQVELAKRSQVALRTLIGIESSLKTKRVRFDVVVRLAHALETPPKSWLEMVGHKDITEGRIAEVLKKIGVSDYFGQEEPSRFFENLEARLNEHKAIVICICYRTFSNFNHQTQLAKYIAPLVEKGNLYVALICPYPKIKDIDEVSKQTLSRIYFQVRSEVIGTAKDVKTAIKKNKSHVAAFSLNERFENCIPPTTGLSEFRPILIKLISPDPTEMPKYELSGWVAFLRDQKERWINMYPPPEKMKEHEDSFFKICTAWKDYFSNITEACKTADSRGWINEGKELGVWSMANIDEPSK